MSMSIYLGVSLVLLVTVVCISAITLYKVRKIHITQYAIKEQSDRIYHEAQFLYAQLQTYYELVVLLGFDKPLPTLRGWAASPDFLLKIAKSVLADRPVNILECSSGASTLILARCMQMNGSGHVYSLEHDSAYASKTRQELMEQGLGDWATVIDAPLKELSMLRGHIWYDPDALPVLDVGVDMVVVDGPPATTCALARYPAFPMLKHTFSAECKIFLDDADRADEIECIDKWLKLDDSYYSTDLHCEKGAVMLEKRMKVNGNQC